jgi:hypothetical protein
MSEFVPYTLMMLCWHVTCYAESREEKSPRWDLVRPLTHNYRE